MKLTTHRISTTVPCPLRILVAADLHGRTYQNAVALAESVCPDLILCPGDMMDGTSFFSCKERCNLHGFRFMEQAAAIAPLYYAQGNHERGMSEENAALLRKADIHLLDNTLVSLDCGITIGGLTSGYVNSIRATNTYAPAPPDTAFLQEFAASHGFKVLLCHHPEYYDDYIRHLPIHLIVSGHAHGGQWRLFGRGVFAPGQGLFPRYTAGVHENRLAISCGMANTIRLPRFFNPRELLLLELVPVTEGDTP